MLTPDEIVADIESMKPRKGKVTIYQSWPRMILEREREAVALAAAGWAVMPAQAGEGLREALEEAMDLGIYPKNGGPKGGPRTRYQDGWNAACIQIAEAFEKAWEDALARLPASPAAGEDGT